MTKPDTEQLETAEEELNRLDGNRMDFYSRKLEAFMERIQPGDGVLINTHPDADGLASAAFVKKYLERKFGKRIYVSFSFHILASEEFTEKASAYNHVICCDQWIDNEEEKQTGLRELIKEGKNILVLDHHDKYFNQVDSLDPDLYSRPYDPLTPETIPYGLGVGSYDRFCYISPTRLGSTISSSKFPAGVLAYRMLRSIDPRVEDQKYIVPIAVLGDGAAQEWENLLRQYSGDVKKALEVADIANLASNLRALERLTRRFLRSKISAHPYEDILKSSDLDGVKRIQALIAQMTEDILSDRIPVQRMNNANGGGACLYYHITEQDEKRASRLVKNDTIKRPPDLDNGLATALSRQIGTELTVVVTQFERKQDEIKGLRIRFRDERNDKDHSMIPLAEKFEGSGHDMASLAIIPATDITAQDVLRRVQGQLANLFQI